MSTTSMEARTSLPSMRTTSLYGNGYMSTQQGQGVCMASIPQLPQRSGQPRPQAYHHQPGMPMVPPSHRGCLTPLHLLPLLHRIGQRMGITLITPNIHDLWHAPPSGDLDNSAWPFVLLITILWKIWDVRNTKVLEST